MKPLDWETGPQIRKKRQQFKQVQKLKNAKRMVGSKRWKIKKKVKNIKQLLIKKPSKSGNRFWYWKKSSKVVSKHLWKANYHELLIKR